MVVSNEVKKMLINNATIGELKEQAIRDGMLTMKQDGMVKVREGITTFDEVMNSVFTIG
jgi:type IV pilus assembly protein PilB